MLTVEELERIPKSYNVLNKSKQELLQKGVPERAIIYVCRNGPSDDGKFEPYFSTLGQFSITDDVLRHALEYGDETYEYLALDGRDTDKMEIECYGMLDDLIKEDWEGWKRFHSRYVNDNLLSISEMKDKAQEIIKWVTEKKFDRILCGDYEREIYDDDAARFRGYLLDIEDMRNHIGVLRPDSVMPEGFYSSRTRLLKKAEIIFNLLSTM